MKLSINDNSDDENEEVDRDVNTDLTFDNEEKLSTLIVWVIVLMMFLLV